MIDQVITTIRTIKQYDHTEIGEGTNLIANLAFTSMDIMNLILALEQQFGITFRDEDLDLDHFITVRAVLDTLAAHQEDKP